MRTFFHDMRTWVTVILVTVVIALVSAVPVDAGGKYKPIALVHGISNSSAQMDLVVQWIEDSLPGVYVKAFEIGDGKWDSIMMGMNEQLDILIKEIQADEQISAAPSFNLVGYSQGGLLARGYIEKCNDPPVHNFISWSAPQAGQYGIPYVMIEWIDELIGRIPYEKQVQEHFSFAQYWNDPYKQKIYLEKSFYLADLNNEKDEKNATYRDRMCSLNYMRNIWSNKDRTIQPPQSAMWSFWDETGKKLVPLREREFYMDDFLGLKTLDENNRLDLVEVSIEHYDYPNAVGYDIFVNYTLPLLK